MLLGLHKGQDCFLGEEVLFEEKRLAALVLLLGLRTDEIELGLFDGGEVVLAGYRNHYY